MIEGRAFPAAYAERYRAAGYWTDETFAEFVVDRTTRFAARLAVVGVDAHGLTVRWTYADLADAADDWAERLAGAGVDPGDRVVVALPNVVEFVAVVLGCFRRGVVPVFAQPGHREAELTQFCRIADVVAVVVCGETDGFDHLALLERVGERLRERGLRAPVVVDVQAGAGHRGPSDEGAGHRGASTSERHETPSPLRILFVCTANICRSPYMELRAKALTGANDRVEFLSAGTHGFRAHAVDATMAESLHDRGVDAELIDGFTSQRLTRELIASADLVLTAEASHREYVLEEAPAAFRKVFTLGQFAESVARLDPGLNGRALVTAVGHRRAGASTLQDIRDPFRRGRAAADASADQIDALFQAVLGRLTGPEADL